MSLFSWFRHRSPGRMGGQCAPWSPETDKFVALAVKSGLRNAAELRDAFNAFRCEVPTPHENGCAELHEFCNQLVKNNALTRWQCDKPLEGRHRGFFLDTFKLLHHVGCDETCSRYAAEDIHTKRRVVLRVLPRFVRRREDGQPNYEVEEPPAAD